MTDASVRIVGDHPARDGPSPFAIFERRQAPAELGLMPGALFFEIGPELSALRRTRLGVPTRREPDDLGPELGRPKDVVPMRVCRPAERHRPTDLSDEGGDLDQVRRLHGGIHDHALVLPKCEHGRRGRRPLARMEPHAVEELRHHHPGRVPPAKV